MENFNLRGCWLVNVPRGKNGYSFGVYVNYDADEDEIIDMCRQNDLFECTEDSNYANAELMTEYDFEHFKNEMITLSA